MIKSLIRKFHNSLRAKKTFTGPPQKTDPVVPPTKADVSRPDKILVQASPEKRKRPEQPRPPRPKRRQDKWDVSRFDVPSIKGQCRFHDLGLPDKIMHAIADLDFRYCMPIQAKILPKTLEGSDATGKAQTGTGKSAAFLVNIYTQLLKKPLHGKRRPGIPRALILAPTRELVLQIEKDARAIGKYTNIRIQSVFGGLGYEKQKRALAEKVIDIIVATPGRLLDFQRQKLLRFYKLEILVIDEADRMLDMGFIPDVGKIIRSAPPKQKRQTMFFSATLTPEVERLSEQWTVDPVHVEIEPEHIAPDSVNQIVYLVSAEEKFNLLVNLAIEKNLERVLVFTNRRDQARRLADRLKEYGLNCASLSGDVPQNRRIRTLEDFRHGKINVLVATDVASRGLHIEDISHVINFNLPHDPEAYVHRIGRTGRAGATGISVSFACEEDSFYIPPIEEYLGNALSCVHPDEELLIRPSKVKTALIKERTPARSKKRYPKKRRRTPSQQRSHSRQQNRGGSSR